MDPTRASDNSPVVDEAQDAEIVVRQDSAEDEYLAALGDGKSRKYARFVMAALGSVPWIGALASLSAEVDQEKLSALQKLWIEEHRSKYANLKGTLGDILMRLDGLGEETQERVEAPEYLSLVGEAFKGWDDAGTDEKREYIKRLISNAGATKLVPDDLVRMFIGWIRTYHESHFAVIKQIFKQPGITRGEIWDQVHTDRPREDSAEADLFRYLIRDLSLGGVIRQDKEVRDDGMFMRKRATHTPKGMGSQTMESSFEDTKPYVLTKLGEQFIHYVLNDVVQRVEGRAGASKQEGSI